MATPAEEAQRALEIAQRQRALERAQNVQSMLGQPQAEPFQQQSDEVGADTSPIPHNEVKRIPPTRRFGGFIGQTSFESAIVQNHNQKIDLMDAGINVAAELPADVRSGLSLTSNNTLKVAYLQSKGYEVRILPGSDDIQYFDAQSNRWANIDSINVTFSDVADLAGMPLPTLFAIGGGLLGARAPGKWSPWGMAAGGAVGSSFGEYANFAIAKHLGLTERMGWDEGLAEAAEVGAIDFGIEMLGFGAGRGYRWASQFITPTGLNMHLARRALSNLRPEDAALVNYIEVLSGQRFLPLTGQMTNDEYLLSLLGQVRDDIELGAKLSTLLKENEGALLSAFNALDVWKKNNPDKYQALQELQKSIQDINPTIQQQAAQEVENIRAGLEGELRYILDSTSYQETSGAIADLYIERLNNYNAEIRTLYDAVRKEAGNNPGSSFVRLQSDDELRKYWFRAKKELRNALTGPERRAMGDIFNDVIDLHITGNKLEDGTTIKNIDFLMLDNHIRFVNSEMIAPLTKDPLTGRPLSSHSKKAQTLIEYVDTLRAWRNRELARQGRVGMLDNLTKAETMVKNRREEFNDSLLPRIFDWTTDEVTGLKRWVVRSNLESQLLLGHAFSNPQALAEIVGAVADDPYALYGLQEAFNNFYAFGFKGKGVIDPTTSLPDAKLHDEFVNEFSQQIDLLYPIEPGNSASVRANRRVRTLGQYGKVIEQKKAELDALQAELKQRWPTKLGKASLNPASLVDEILKGGNVSMTRQDVQELMRLLPQDQIGNLQRATHEWVAHQILDPSNETNPFKLGSFQRLLSGETADRIAKIDVIMAGDEAKGPGLLERMGSGKYSYTENLRKIYDALQISRRRGASERALPVTTPLYSLFRIINAPMSPQGRGQTFVMLFRRRRATEVMFEALKDPKRLAELIELDEKQASREQFIRWLSVMGAPELAEELVGEPTQQTPQEFLFGN